MKNRLTLRLRLTVVTSLTLTLTCAVFTLFSIYTAGNTISAALSTTPATGGGGETTVGGTEEMPAEEAWPAPIENETVAPLEDTLTGAAPLPGVPAAALAELSQMHTRQFSKESLLFMGGAIVSGSLVMYVASGLILRPLKKLSATISTIDKEGLDTRIEGYRSKDELNTLADSFNLMMDRLHRAFERERRFSADAAHELKTPLAVMKTNMEVLDETATLQDYQKTFHILKKQADRMALLICQLLEFSSMNRGTFTKRVEMDELVGNVVHEYCGDGAEMNLKSCSLKGDELLLKQAVSNLVQNAQKYGDGTVEAETEEKNGFVYVRIKDYGRGVPKEEREKIFEPFYRSDKSRSRASGGNGLGLSIVSEIVRLHGGEVYCRSNEREGTALGSVFTIKLPK